jgi:integrase
MREKITQRRLEASQRAKRTAYLWDTELKGFGLYASASGDVSWLVQKWIGGRKGKATRFAFDHYPRLKLDDARTQAAVILGEMATGVDPVARRRKERQAHAERLNGDTLKEAYDRYLKRNQKPGRHWIEVDRMFRADVLPVLGERTLVASITKQDVRTLIDRKQDAGSHGVARYLFAALRPFFKWCVERDLIAQSPMDALQAPAPVKSRDRLLTRDEIKAFWKASESLSDGPWMGYLRVCLLTGQRRDEVASMEWTELDQTAGIWTIPGARTKNGKAHIVHLSPQCLAELAKVDKIQSCKYVFSTTGKTPLKSFSDAKDKMDAIMQTETPWRLHDLRRTLVSVLAELGIPTDVADRVLNHVSGSKAGVKGVYQRYEFLAERKRALETWGQFVENLVAGAEKGSNFVSSDTQRALVTA